MSATGSYSDSDSSSGSGSGSGSLARRSSFISLGSLSPASEASSRASSILNSSSSYYILRPFLYFIPFTSLTPNVLFSVNPLAKHFTSQNEYLYMPKRPVFLSILIGKFCRSWLWNWHAFSNLESFIPYRKSSTRSFSIFATALKRLVPRSLSTLAT